MKIRIVIIVFMLTTVNFATVGSSVAMEKTHYEANWQSLSEYPLPQWAKDAKFGIYAHWGAYSVSGRWDYSKANWGNAYITPYKGIYSHDVNNEARRLFEKNVGRVADGYGYKDLAKQFTAENFDADYWADLIYASGAKYAGIAAMHHDGYALWDSDVTDFSVGKLGPKRDLLGEVFTALEARGLKTIASFHHARTYKHYQKLIKHLDKNNAPFAVDLTDPANENFYWFVGDTEKFAANRYKLTQEVINKYKPDVLWFDGGGGKFGTEQVLADYFNMAEAAGKQVTVHNKGNFPEKFGIYSYENGHARPSYVNWPWEDDTPSAVGWCDWPWFKDIEYKKPRDIVVRLVDLVSRNGGLLLSLNPRPDGTLDKPLEDLLRGIGQWMATNGDAIHATVPWKIYAEGHTENLFYIEQGAQGQKSRAIQPDVSKFNWQDVRFTRNGDRLFATVLGVPPSGYANIKSLNTETQVSDKNKITGITLLGHGDVEWHRDDTGVRITLPKNLPNTMALVFEVFVAGLLDKTPPPVTSVKMKMPKQT